MTLSQKLEQYLMENDIDYTDLQKGEMPKTFEVQIHCTCGNSEHAIISHSDIKNNNIYIPKCCE